MMIEQLANCLMTLRPSAQFACGETYESIQWLDKEQSLPTVDEVMEVQLTVIKESQLAIIREERNRLLAECDWTQASDAPLTDAQKAQWQTYRQELRDYPLNINSSNIKWPSVPL